LLHFWLLLGLSWPLFLFGGPGWFLLFRFCLLVCVGLCSLVLLRIHGNDNSEHEGQSAHTDNSGWFHAVFLHGHDLVGHSLLASRVVIVSCGCRPSLTVECLRHRPPRFTSFPMQLPEGAWIYFYCKNVG